MCTVMLTFIISWFKILLLLYVDRIRDDIEKEDAFRGLCLMVSAGLLVGTGKLFGFEVET